jgi:hypothetical protein
MNHADAHVPIAGRRLWAHDARAVQTNMAA